MKNDPKRVIVIGCGGIGSWLAPALAKTLQFQAPHSALILIDGDSFEPKNAERQQFSHVGNKAHVLAGDIQDSVRNVFILPRAAWIVSEEKATDEEEYSDDENSIVVTKVTAASILEEGDIVYACVDNYKARKLIFDAAQSYANIDIFTGGNDDRLFGTVYHYRRRNGEDITLPPSHFHDEFVNPDDANPGELSCQERAELDGGTQLLSVNMAVAAQLLAKTAHAIFGTPQEEQAVIEKAEVYFDLELGLSQPYDRRLIPAEVNASVSV